jgi:histidine triad (HIT) family protein
MNTTQPRFELAPYDDCSICRDIAGTRECAIVAGSELAIAQVNLRQYERGAMLVTPRAHRETVLDIREEEICATYLLARRVARAAAIALGAVGMNIYQNSGLKAGQHEPHFHVHVVPRYPNSEPGRRFSQLDFEPVPMEEQRAIADLIRAAL